MKVINSLNNSPLFGLQNLYNEISDHAQDEKGSENGEFGLDAESLIHKVCRGEAQRFPQSVVGEASVLFPWENHSIQSCKKDESFLMLFDLYCFSLQSIESKPR